MASCRQLHPGVSTYPRQELCVEDFGAILDGSWAGLEWGLEGFVRSEIHAQKHLPIRLPTTACRPLQGFNSTHISRLATSLYYVSTLIWLVGSIKGIQECWSMEYLDNIALDSAYQLLLVRVR